ncbi:rCG27587, isoform CRA_a [Rattus norvegicus]|uniref:RCG27587, isoform CRA_a n=1 Tax=Rattus norvegicus TaxID=10116 RepID=A6K7D0_RAT|nr:rCG27587, isoform CRA_a [Rattus norvegicus]
MKAELPDCYIYAGASFPPVFILPLVVQTIQSF